MPPVVSPPARALLAWYDRHRRRMPWRALPGEPANPYCVWLSEIMLQQTTVAAVIPYYERFLARFPDVSALADAPEESVMQAWAGLGYYARARNLHACARVVAALGGFPASIEGLRALPGVGPYTAAAIGAIAFDLPTVPVDGNVERVVARLFCVEEPLPRSKPAIAAGAAALGGDPDAQRRPSDFAQALFDLGATVCTPKSPTCALCPWMAACTARARGIAPDLPRKAPRKPRPVRYGAHFWLTDAAGRVLLRRRPSKGLMGGMTELPGTEWRLTQWPQDEALRHAPAAAPWRRAGEVHHGLTHFELRITVFAAQIETIAADTAQHQFAIEIRGLDSEALPSVMRKCVVVGAATRVTEQR